MVTGDERVPDDARLPTVRRRLREVREEEGLSLNRTVKVVSQFARTSYSHVQVRRYEGGEKGRSDRPANKYVHAFARAFSDSRFATARGLEESELRAYLLAEDALAFPVNQLAEGWREHRRAYAAHLRRASQEGKDVRRDLLRDQVSAGLGMAALLPHPQPDGVALPRDTLSWILDDLQRLFWEAFGTRGLNPEETQELAVRFGFLIPSPPRLPVQGFLRYSEIPEPTLRRWWVLQAEALRVLLRPNRHPFEPEQMNLGRFGEGGYPVPWREWVKDWDEARDLDLEGLLTEIRSLTPDKGAP